MPNAMVSRRPQLALPLDPTEDEVVQEVRRIWLSRPYWRRLFKTEAELLACPARASLLRRCARHACLARARQAAAGRC